jgi:hypothetical protein
MPNDVHAIMTIELYTLGTFNIKANYFDFSRFLFGSFFNYPKFPISSH